MVREIFVGLSVLILIIPLPSAIILNILGYHSGQEGYSIMLIIMEIVGVILLFWWDPTSSKAESNKTVASENKTREDKAVSTSSPEGN